MKPAILKSAQHWLLYGRHLGRIATVCAVLALLLAVFSLAAAAGNTHAWADNYNLILWLNVGLSGMLALLVVGLLTRLLWRLKQEKFGARLTLKFALAFSGFGLVPGVLVYLVSLLFLHQSIESWFNVRVDTALNAGIQLSRSAIDTLLLDLTQRARLVALDVDAIETPKQAQTQVEKVRLLYPNAAVTIFTHTGQVLAFSGVPNVQTLNSEDIPNEFARLGLRRSGLFSQIEAAHDSDPDAEKLNLRVAVSIPVRSEVNTSSAPITRYYLQLVQPVPASMLQLAQSVTQGLKDYETLALGRAGLRKIYGTTLTLTMLLAVLASVVGGFVLADALISPLLRLARGTLAVAAGNFEPLPETGGKDDLAVLTRSFNHMSAELSGARQALNRNTAFLEQVLSTLSTGVVILDPQQQVISTNPAARAILGMTDLMPNELPHEFMQLVLTKQDTAKQKKWQLQPEIRLNKDSSVKTLLLSASPLELAHQQNGLLLVFDDISEVIIAQRAQAWGDVARRLAHEIKNPLTPIQLSAERLAIKLSQKLQSADAELLKRGTDTIVMQVTALKNMVDEFRNFARLPQAKMQKIDIHDVLKEILTLYAEREESQQFLTVQLLAEQSVCMVDPLQLRQVIHNLIVNAYDAAAQHMHPAQVKVLVETFNLNQSLVLRVADNGLGFSQVALDHLFEPYHTTKAKGTGLGLAVIHKIVQDHGATISVHNAKAQSPYTGASIDIVFPLVTEVTLNTQTI